MKGGGKAGCKPPMRFAKGGRVPAGAKMGDAADDPDSNPYPKSLPQGRRPAHIDSGTLDLWRRTPGAEGYGDRIEDMSPGEDGKRRGYARGGMVSTRGVKPGKVTKVR